MLMIVRDFLSLTLRGVFHVKSCVLFSCSFTCFSFVLNDLILCFRLALYP
ncbi:hypothetical protein Lalb_Chr11g0070441 [Lupinus albus]|uniref:Uncharacterized protein n=1 Tax=Lupinus albus TaxID=3870 RepID=A0A6A4PSV5_LUPAL|nr:hypothetical protein Lalb_Chr11g0070441 [Lupinus albus]